MRKCKVCKIEKDESNYYRYPARKRQLPGQGSFHTLCKPCTIERVTRYKEKKQRSLKSSCDACGATTIRLCRDHDHESGEDRGTLCHNCNVSLGLLDDSPQRLWELYCYLVKYHPDRDIMFSDDHESV